MKPIVWTSRPVSRLLTGLLPLEPRLVSSAHEFVAESRDQRTISFLDSSTLEQLDSFATSIGPQGGSVPDTEWRKLYAAVTAPTVAICDEPLETAIGRLTPHPWLGHVISRELLESPTAEDHLADVVDTLSSSREPKLLEWLRPGGGRRVRLTHASRRGERLEKMNQYFAAQETDKAAIAALGTAAEELLTNAFYEAPLAAGAVSKRIPRSSDVALPDEFGCELAYGVRADLAIVRVQDPFGALSRDRLVEVLERARTKGRNESPGTGFFRVISQASILAISVVANKRTEVFVGIPKRAQSRGNAFALHLFFKAGAKRAIWKFIDEDTGRPMFSQSVTLSVIPD